MGQQTPGTERSSDQAVLDGHAMEIFNRAVEELGGAGGLLVNQESALLPTLMESAYILVLAEEAHLPQHEIAGRIGVSEGAVRAVFEAPTEAAVPRFRGSVNPTPEFKTHTDPDWNGMPETDRMDPEFLAGAVAKFAYEAIKRERGQRSQY